MEGLHGGGGVWRLTPTACCRYMDAQTKIEALQLIASIIRGLGDRDRNVMSIQSDALKAAVRVVKEAATSETSLAAAGKSVYSLVSQQTVL